MDYVDFLFNIGCFAIVLSGLVIPGNQSRETELPHSLFLVSIVGIFGPNFKAVI